ncbi:MAG: response regulator [Acidobacteria bacterium]|nr:response regulator [Acidobacteriota bacterium]
MMSWFDRLPIHRKLVAIALLVTTVALSLAAGGLMILDFVSYRQTAIRDMTALASVVAENTAAAVMFAEPKDADVSLSAVRVRPNVSRACLYLPDGELFAAYSRDASSMCPTEATVRSAWNVVTGMADVNWNDRQLGRIYIERELTELWSRGAVAIGAGLVMLTLAAGVAFLIAHRLHRTVSQPIVRLADAVRALDAGRPAPALPRIHAGLDEVGDLVKAFDDMLRRVGEATESLRRKEVEREGLLVREREASRLKDEFLATVSHELRTPLNAIVGWTQILASTAVDDATRTRALQTIARNAQAQARVIEDLVDVSRIVTGKLHLRFTPVDLRDAIEGAVEVIRPAAQAKNIALTIDRPPAPSFVRGDRDRLQQIIWNLLSNAVKFTPAGGAVTVRVVLSDSHHEVRVSDTGAGIPAAFLPFVFDRFRQADGSTTRAHGGLGLGLAIVKELTELHGGSVDVTSAGPGLGSCFVVRLPAFDGRDETTALQPPGTPMSSKALEGVSVLVVDDNPDALDVLSATLATAGADVRTASSGTEALATWSREPAQVLLCDIAMPDIDGLEVLRRIREADARAGRFTPAIALSAHAGRDHATRSVQAGFARHLTKPYVAAELVRTLSDVLAQRP